MPALKARVFHTVFDLINLMALGNLPPILAVAAIIERNGSILFIDRSDGLGLSFPGGIVKWNETCKAAARREVHEETGYEIVITGLVGVYSDLKRDPRFRCVEIVYASVVVAGNGRSSREGQIDWIPKTSLPRVLGFDHQHVIGDYLKNGACRCHAALAEDL
ncbi:MAG: NUDIX hydrolase [Chloroflexota bacterium]|nr:NUDIX hydrolase [Chloroflexota bacterium]